MRCCKNCRTLYSDSLSACPKCGIDEAAAEDAALRDARPGELRRQWLTLLIGIPLLILALYGIITFLNR